MLSKEILELYAESDREPAARQSHQDRATTPDGATSGPPLRDLLFWPSIACACVFCWAILMAVADRQ